MIIVGFWDNLLSHDTTLQIACITSMSFVSSTLKKYKIGPVLWGFCFRLVCAFHFPEQTLCRLQHNIAIILYLFFLTSNICLYLMYFMPAVWSKCFPGGIKKHTDSQNFSTYHTDIRNSSNAGNLGLELKRHFAATWYTVCCGLELAQHKSQSQEGRCLDLAGSIKRSPRGTLTFTQVTIATCKDTHMLIHTHMQSWLNHSITHKIMLEQSASASDGCGASFVLWPTWAGPHPSSEI